MYLEGDVKASSEFIYPNQKEDGAIITNIFYTTPVRAISIVRVNSLATLNWLSCISNATKAIINAWIINFNILYNSMLKSSYFLIDIYYYETFYL